MNRREMLKCSAGCLVFGLPNFWAAPKPTWFTHGQLMHLFNQLDGKTTRETVDMYPSNKLINGRPIMLKEVFYLACSRMSNIMYRRTLDGQSQHWLVVNPERPELWSERRSKYCSQDMTWHSESWRKFIKEEVSSGVYDVGTLNNYWRIYVDEQFPDNKVMLGMGYKEVIHFRKEGTNQIIAYMGRPKMANYAIVTLKY